MRYKVFDVFARAPLEGNPTGIVYYEGPEDTSLMQRLATEFPVPDTLFFTRKTNAASLFACRTFSPYEELAICAQGLIGAMYALMEDGQVGSGHYVVETALGSRGLQLEHNETTSIFCSLGCPTLSEPHEDERIHIARLGFNDCIAPPPMAYVDLGRKRLVVEVPASTLEQAVVGQAVAMDVCRALEITGIVVFARDATSAGLIRSRHFTTSLNGCEDAVTGGAAGAILAFWQKSQPEVRELQVYQGGFATRGGWIHTKRDSPDGDIWIGGTAVKMLEGEIQSLSANKGMEPTR
jgi:trans-2,3-dihydro-3-hydroxyanthranilate isomerase